MQYFTKQTLCRRMQIRKFNECSDCWYKYDVPYPANTLIVSNETTYIPFELDRTLSLIPNSNRFENRKQHLLDIVRVRRKKRWCEWTVNRKKLASDSKNFIIFINKLYSGGFPNSIAKWLNWNCKNHYVPKKGVQKENIFLEQVLIFWLREIIFRTLWRVEKNVF